MTTANEWLTVTDLFTEEIAAFDLRADDLSDTSQAVIAALAPVLDQAIAPLEKDTEALRVTAAALRSYARIAEMYASARDAEAGA
jgi:hypothetical protein